MRFKYVIPTLCIFGTMSLHAEESGLSDIIQQVAQKEKLIKPEPQKKKPKKKVTICFS